MTPPIKPKTDNFPRVFRGGSWIVTSATFVRAAFRGGNSPTFRNFDFGFRTTQSGCRQQVLKVQP